jgi:hypothetical protein
VGCGSVRGRGPIRRPALPRGRAPGSGSARVALYSMACGDEVDILPQCHRGFALVHFARGGPIEVVTDGHRTGVAPGEVMISAPRRSIALRGSADCEKVLLRVPEALLGDVLHAPGADPANAAVELEPSVLLDGAAAHGWRAQLHADAQYVAFAGSRHDPIRAERWMRVVDTRPGRAGRARRARAGDGLEPAPAHRLGRFARLYRERFGKYPNESRRRCGPEPPRRPTPGCATDRSADRRVPALQRARDVELACDAAWKPAVAAGFGGASMPAPADELDAIHANQAEHAAKLLPKHDVIDCGGGSAACALAGQLAADGRTNILRAKPPAEAGTVSPG